MMQTFRVRFSIESFDVTLEAEDEAQAQAAVDKLLDGGLDGWDMPDEWEAEAPWLNCDQDTPSQYVIQDGKIISRDELEYERIRALPVEVPTEIGGEPVPPLLQEKYANTVARDRALITVYGDGPLGKARERRAALEAAEPDPADGAEGAMKLALQKLGLDTVLAEVAT
jgi:hypothetical protein